MKRHIVQMLCTLSLLAVMVFIPEMNLCGSEKPAPTNSPSTIHQGPCSKRVGDCTITLDISPKPVKAMEDLIFTVTLAGDCSSGAPGLDLSMPGMVMGENKVPLKKRREGVFQGTGIIVRCPSGRKTWQATVTVPNHNTVDFIFDVVY